MKYIYNTVQIPPNIQINTKERGSEAASYLSTILNQKAHEGWEFQSVETIGVAGTPGCLGALMGHKQDFTTYYVIVFRREMA